MKPYYAKILIAVLVTSSCQTGTSTPDYVSVKNTQMAFAWTAVAQTVYVDLPATVVTTPTAAWWMTPEVTATPIAAQIQAPPAVTNIVSSTLSLTEISTPIPIDTSDLPKLTDVILSSEDIESLDEFGSNPLISVANKTKELGASCLWDCAKHLYSLEHGTLTIVLLRAGSQQKADHTSESLRADFLKAAGVEYTTNDISNISLMAWSIVDAASSTRDFRTSAAGIAHGEIVILATYSQNFCEYMPNYGRYCEGDIMGLAMTSIEYLNLQIQKLQIAGYKE